MRLFYVFLGFVILLILGVNISSRFFDLPDDFLFLSLSFFILALFGVLLSKRLWQKRS